MSADYKRTINLPATNFPMKADLPKQEPRFLEKWNSTDLYGKIRRARQGAKPFILHDGPPYANGDIHMGHALNKILKDVIVKYKTMRGYDAPFVPGWDCHGLPVEHQLFKELKITKHQIDAPSFRKKAAGYAMGFVAKQKEQFKRLGVFGRWETPYLTLDPAFEGAVVDAFAALVEKGFIYQSLKPVHWCISCETALAEAELEYDENHVSPSLYCLFPVEWDRISAVWPDAPQTGKLSFAVWTTTPWTLVANVAVALHPDLEYAFVKTKNFGTVIVAEDRIDAFLKVISTAPSEVEVVWKRKGIHLNGLAARHPFMDRASGVVTADYVSRTDGTGCVHTAPGHGMDDYRTGLKWKLPVLMPVNEKGLFTGEAGEWKGWHIAKANRAIPETISRKGNLLHAGEIRHSYPTCWRCKEPVITRATRQWFMGVDRQDLRRKILTAIQKVRWVPPSGQNRITGMIESRPDWCLSRQRYWGVPVPVFTCAACDDAVLDPALIRRVGSEFRTRGSDAWFDLPAEGFTRNEFPCPRCGRKDLKKGQDILDVWFESGASYIPVLVETPEPHFPADLYLEGSDQHRGWFQSSLLVSCANSGGPPYRTVLTHGFIVDGEGRKMSKSQGNVISPLEVMKEYGADILRLWVASSDASDDVRLSGDGLRRLSEGYRKIRNTFRFLLGNLSGFDASRDSLGFEELTEVDRWALSKLESLKEEVTAAYEDFQLHRVVHLVYDFCVVEMSSFYLDVLKDRLYTDARGSVSGRSCRTALHEILTTLARLLAPVLVFTCEEVWQNLGLPESVHLESWPEPDPRRRREALEAKWERLLLFREKVLKALEEKREKKEIGNSLEAEVELALSKKEDLDFLKDFEKDLPGLFLVSGVRVAGAGPGASDGGWDVTVRKAAGRKCERCWNTRRSVGEDKEHQTLCRRCVEGDTVGRRDALAWRFCSRRNRRS
ncbi:MAG: isoleucine--tRNA ligase [Candidatus Omnitrophica bacterium]|nr:isoleucine--tRNA ligase [Candidatus Omnitrophota bacterium]